MAEATPEKAKAPWHLWTVGAISLLWNLVGATDFAMTQAKISAYVKAFTPAQAEFYYSFPLWAVITWGIAVWGGVLGSLFLLLRRRRAVHLFLASSICVVLTDIYSYVLSNGLRVMGGAGALVFSAVIFAISLLLLAYARSMTKRTILV